MLKSSSLNTCFIIFTIRSFSFGTTASFEYDANVSAPYINTYYETSDITNTTFNMQMPASIITDSNGKTYDGTNYIGFTLDEEGNDINKAGVNSNKLYFQHTNGAIGPTATALFSFDLNTSNDLYELKLTDSTTFSLTGHGLKNGTRYLYLQTDVSLAVKSGNNWYVTKNNALRIPEVNTPTPTDSIDIKLEDDWIPFVNSHETITDLSAISVKGSSLLNITELGFYVKIDASESHNANQEYITALSVDNLELTAVPEPSTYAFILGSFSFLLSIYIRKIKR